MATLFNKVSVGSFVEGEDLEEMIWSHNMEKVYYDQEADLCYTMEEEYIHPLDAFFNLERYEGETSAHLFIRMVNIF